MNPLASGWDRVATVLVFTTTDCPISNRYAPEIQSLAATFQTQGIGFTLVYPVSTDTPGVIREHVKKFGYALPVVRDTAQELVKHTGVRVTPEVAVIGAGGQVRIGAVLTTATSTSARTGLSRPSARSSAPLRPCGKASRSRSAKPRQWVAFSRT